MCAQGHSVAGSGCAVSFVLLLFYGQVEKTPKSQTYVFTGWVICGVVGEHKHVCSKAMLMMLLQLPGFWSWAAVVALLQLGAGFKLLLSKGPGSPEVLPCSAWAICGVVGEHTHVCAQGHSVAGFVREHKHVCSKACDAHDVAAAAQFWQLGYCYCCYCCCSWVWVLNCS